MKVTKLIEQDHKLNVANARFSEAARAGFLPRLRTGLLLAIGVIIVAVGFGVASSLGQSAGNAAAQEWTAPSRASRKQNPIAADPATIAKGKELFTAACLPCHGPSGRGDGPSAATLERNGTRVRPGNLSDPKMWLQSDGAIFWKISEGNTPMPAFQETFTEEQRWQVVNYVRTLAPHSALSPQTTKDGPQNTNIKQ
jgi:mono/diheme cytochrome c family protein